MNILIIDKDTLSSNMIRAKVENMGHIVHEQGVKNDALDKIGQTPFDIVFIDPAPLTNPRSLIMNIRRNASGYVYIILMHGSDAAPGDNGLSGANDLMAKPVDPQALQDKITQAECLLDIVRTYGDEREDFPSAGGVIAKSAFNQLFLSAMERADRYGEHTYLLRLAVKNYEKLKETGGNYLSDFAVAKLSQHMVRIRRQSDIIGQTGRNEYTLLLQRPQYETEPVDAANRFAEAFSQLDDLSQGMDVLVELEVRLIELPTGHIKINHNLKIQS